MKAEAARAEPEALPTVGRDYAALDRQIRAYEKALAALQEENEALANRNLQLAKEYEHLHRRYQREKTTVIKPAYRRLYQACGRLLRWVVPESLIDSLKRLIPHPDGTPRHLTGLRSRRDKQLSSPIDFAEPAENSKPDIFVLSIINWRFRYQRPQHLAKGLAQSGRRVFYVEMDRTAQSLELEALGDNLFRMRFAYEGSRQVKNYTGQASPTALKNWIQSFYAVCDSLKATSHKQIIVEHPFWWQFVKHLPPEFQIIYDCMDDISGFPETSRFVLNLEEELLHHCDTLVVSSERLYQKYREFREPHLIRNAAAVEHFARAVPDDQTLDLNGKLLAPRNAGPDSIRVGYVGAIAEWFDHELLEQVARRMDKAEFHLCGAVSADGPARLDSLSNVTMYGEIPYAAVPGFISQMDVMIIPFKLLPIIIACDPVKFYEFCAMGTPTVSTAMPELARTQDRVFIASTSEEFAEKIATAHQCSQDEDYCARLRDYAAQNTWGDRVGRFVQALEDFPKVSVIILSYGDPALTMETISSFYDGGPAYPNLEVLLVDNGSSQEQLELIKAHIAPYQEVTLIENRRNLGFARGNNVGIEAATGEYVMLLNNDTYLAPGAIQAMVRHLRHNPEIGAVGPLTNNIGNEAKLEVKYSGMAEMKKVAREVTAGYRGRYTLLNKLAYFGVMFRRDDLATFGLLPEDYGLGMFEDDDHCQVIRSKGYVCALAEDAFVHHVMMASFSRLKQEDRQALFEENQKIFEEKWGPWIPHDFRNRRPPSSLQDE